MKIAQISDLHIVAEGDTLGVAPMAQNLARVVTHINEAKPELVLISGDIANTATLDETRRATTILAALDMPYYLTPGNHDDREVLWEAFGGNAVPARETAHLSYVFETNGYRIVALDSTDPDAHNGRICTARAAWLEARLAEAPTTPTIIFMHHPPMKCGVKETDSPPLDGASLLAEVVSRHSQIKRILCGHIHLPVQALWQGRLVCTAPSLGMRLRFDLSQELGSAFYASPPAYLLHMHNADGTLITHQLTLDNPVGPFSFG